VCDIVIKVIQHGFIIVCIGTIQAQHLTITIEITMVISRRLLRSVVRLSVIKCTVAKRYVVEGRRWYCGIGRW